MVTSPPCAVSHSIILAFNWSATSFAPDRRKSTAMIALAMSSWLDCTDRPEIESVILTISLIWIYLSPAFPAPAAAKNAGEMDRGASFQIPLQNLYRLAQFKRWQRCFHQTTPGRGYNPRHLLQIPLRHSHRAGRGFEEGGEGVTLSLDLLGLALLQGEDFVGEVGR